MKEAGRTDTTPIEALLVVGVCFGWAIAGSLASAAGASASGEFTDAGLVSLAVTELIAAAFALALLAVRRYDVASLLPRPTWHDSGIGIVLALVAGLVGAAAMLPFASGGYDSPIAHLLESAVVSPPMIVLVAFVNGAFEEVFLLGFLQRGLRRHGTSVSLGVMMLVRLLYHVYQGPLGAMYVLGFGSTLGLYHARWNKLWPPVLAHAIWDIVPFMS